MKVTLIYCPYFTGHFSSYVRYILEFIAERHLNSEILFLTSESFLHYHKDITKNLKTDLENKIKIICLNSKEEKIIAQFNDSRVTRITHSFKEINILNRYLKSFKVDHCIALNLDSLALAMVFIPSINSSLSGIYYKPISHYESFFSEKHSFRRKLWVLREKLFLSTIFKNKKFISLFCLDFLAVEYFNKIYQGCKAIYLPDPIPNPSAITCSTDLIQTNRIQMDIEEDRKIFLLFGSLCERKGIYKVIHSLANISDSECERICLIIAGRPRNTKIKQKIEIACEAICSKKPVKIIREYEFLSDSKVALLFNLSDVVLALYQKQIGMSGVLLLGAAYKKPILSSNYGLIGEMVKRYKLGISLDSTSEIEISNGILRLLSGNFTDVCNPKMMESLVNEHSKDKFSSLLLLGK